MVGKLVLLVVLLTVFLPEGHHFPQRGNHLYLPVLNDIDYRQKQTQTHQRLQLPPIPGLDQTSTVLPASSNHAVRTSYMAIPGVYTSRPTGPVLLPSPLPNIPGTHTSQLRSSVSNFNLSNPAFTATLPGEFTATITIGPYPQQPPTSEGSHNKTDVIVINTQKKAYIIPKGNSSSDTSPAAVQHYYANRNNLTNTFTLNQFLFFIAPQNVNFVNN